MQFDTMLTIDEYARLPREADHLELNRGLLVRRPHPGPQHAGVAARIHDALGAFAARTGGRVAFHGRFLLQEEPPTVRAPDVAFMAPGRAAPGAAGVFRGAPDLAVVIAPAPGDGARAELLETVFEYLDGGAAAVWIVDLRDRSLVVYRRSAEPTVYSEGHIIRDGTVLPNFAHPVVSFFT